MTPAFDKASHRGRRSLETIKFLDRFLSGFDAAERRYSWKVFQACRWAGVQYKLTPQGIRPYNET
jgi:hypothetical protein